MDQWATGGSTDIDKLTFTCTPNHKLVGKGWQTRKRSDGQTEWILNRPGESGDSSSWKGWGHVRWFIEEVPAGAA
ncbi:hypothetical protein [Mycobacterium tuberculosis]|uniref:hypothetical protein n=1 Tax=Mycobacterium tuberculosis TaxID=1773 RepID=UPI003F4A4E6F